MTAIPLSKIPLSKRLFIYRNSLKKETKSVYSAIQNNKDYHIDIMAFRKDVNVITKLLMEVDPSFNPENMPIINALLKDYTAVNLFLQIYSDLEDKTYIGKAITMISHTNGYGKPLQHELTTSLINSVINNVVNINLVRGAYVSLKPNVKTDDKIRL